MGEFLAAASVVSSLAGGVMQARAAQSEAAQYAEERRNTEVAAEQDEAERRKELARVLATQQALRAGSGDPFSQTAMNLRRVAIETGEDDIATSRLNYANRVTRLNLAASAAKSRAYGALLSGAANAASAAGDLKLGGNTKLKDW